MSDHPQSTVAPSADGPLTLEDMRWMKGQPVWVRLPDGRTRWAIVSSWGGLPMESEVLLVFGINNYVPASAFISNGSLIYRRKP